MDAAIIALCFAQRRAYRIFCRDDEDSRFANMLPNVCIRRFSARFFNPVFLFTTLRRKRSQRKRSVFTALDDGALSVK